MIEVLVVFLVLALVAPLVLYAVVREEGGSDRRTDRESAERAARRDTDDSSRESW